MSKTTSRPAPRQVLTVARQLEKNGRKKEWVRLSGGEVCLWEMTTREVVTITERASRPSQDPRGGMDPQESMYWQIVLSCYDGDEEGAQPIFRQDAESTKAVYSLSMADFKTLMAGIGQVNGTAPEVMEALTDFTKAREGGLP